MELYSLSAKELNTKLKSKEVSSLEITESVIKRIESIDKNVGCYITTTFDNARQTAKTVDEKISKGENTAPLEGIPVAIKDVMITKGTRTTCASKMLENYVPMYDGTVVRKLKDNNTPILGKTNMDEFAMGTSTENSYFKTTKNPHSFEHIPGGSSGGSAAAVCADETIWAIGSDTGGSIRQPASHCGIVGLKPTYGAVSRFGVIAYASSFDQLGPLTKTVEDAALAMDLMTGHDPMDSTSFNIDYPKYSDALTADVKGLRIGVPKEYFGEGIHPDVQSAIKNAVVQFENMGAHVEETSLPLTDYFLSAYYILACAEASSNLARFDGIKYGYRADKFTDLTDLYKKTRSEGFGAEVKRRIILGTYVLSSGYYDAYYKKGLKVRTLIKNNFAKLFEKYDVLLTPTAPNTAFKFGEKTDNPVAMYMEDLCTVVVNIAGIPAISIPCGLDPQGLPIGMQLMGNHFAESTILRAAYAFEQSRYFKAPKPSLGGVE